MTSRVLRLPEVAARVGLKRTAIYEAVLRGTFPRPLKLGLRASGWLEHEVDRWIDARAAARVPPAGALGAFPHGSRIA